ncbi:MAG: DMT family transporter [Dethiobacteria bacterium]|nr:DMT family transporter [Dethiobacteria bacterium]
MTAHLLGAIYALIAAVLYGGADFSGGVAARRLNNYQVLLLTSLVGVLVLIVLALLWREGLPTVKSIINASLASIFGAIGLATLYSALAYGRASIVAPSSAVVASAIPVIYTAFVQGLPGAITFSGFILASIGIWLTTKTEVLDEEHSGEKRSNDGLLQGVLSGLAFGGFFIFIARIEPGPIFTPLIFGKLAAASVGLLIVTLKRLPLPNPLINPVALLSGFVDVLANVLYLVSTSLTRVDIAAVLVCTYPAATVILAMLFFKEKITRSQALGVLICIVAIALIII